MITKTIGEVYTRDEWNIFVKLVDLIFKGCPLCGAMLYGDGSCLQCEIAGR